MSCLKSPSLVSSAFGNAAVILKGFILNKWDLIGHFCYYMGSGSSFGVLTTNSGNVSSHMRSSVAGSSLLRTAVFLLIRANIVSIFAQARLMSWNRSSCVLFLLLDEENEGGTPKARRDCTNTLDTELYLIHYWWHFFLENSFLRWNACNWHHWRYVLTGGDIVIHTQWNSVNQLSGIIFQLEFLQIFSEVLWRKACFSVKTNYFREPNVDRSTRAINSSPKYSPIFTVLRCSFEKRYRCEDRAIPVSHWTTLIK